MVDILGSQDLNLGQNLSLELCETVTIRTTLTVVIRALRNTSTELWCDVILIVLIRARRNENEKPYKVVLTRGGMPMNHAIPQLDLGDTCRRVSTVNHVHDIDLPWTKSP